MDKNFVGIPKKKYGFSNNVIGQFWYAGLQKDKILFLTQEERT